MMGENHVSDICGFAETVFVYSISVATLPGESDKSMNACTFVYCSFYLLHFCYNEVVM